MRIVIQRVNRASVTIDNRLKSEIGKGLLILLGIEEADTDEDLKWLTAKAVNLRIFDDENGVMNLSVKDVDGEVLVVSQFTLYAATKKGNRPSYIRAAGHATAIPMYERFCKEIELLTGKEVKQGEFGADMQVSLENSGPVTIVIDTKNRE
ncbi:MAG: D-tyrosyl-tRNA(Tyr) deacylase [Muribaculaceae bacterium]|nr:D-tyrosyl-tRNA(Tyr) deacylase [Muribaculaceae bacterium]